MKRNFRLAIIALAAAALVAAYLIVRRSKTMVLTGIVNTDEVIVSPEIQGRMDDLLVRQGDIVTRGQLLARIDSRPWQADLDYYRSTEQESSSAVSQAEADLRFEETQAASQVSQAEANLASAQSQATEAAADLEIARLNFRRAEELYKANTNSKQEYDQARTTNDAAAAHLESLRKQVTAAEAAVAMAKAGADQVASRHAALEANLHQLAAAGAQAKKADVELGYTEIRAPIDGVIDERAALQGEVVSPGQAIVTILDPDDLWVRVDVEESLIDRIRLGETLTVRLPSGAERQGTVFYRAADADYATQRDVSRTKRDIKTFEVRLRCDNKDRALALGMTAYVLLSL